MNWVLLGEFTEGFALLCLFAISVPVWVGLLITVVLVLAPFNPPVAQLIGLLMSTLLLAFTFAGPFYIFSRIKKREVK
jgi:ABC-type transport system involved in multi-copper enzyme maturation permease subunit